MPSEILDTGTVSEVYTVGWKTGYWQGAEYVISTLRALVED